MLAADVDEGRLLLTDLGSTDYLSALADDQPDVLYRDAIDALVVMQKAGDEFRDALPPYDERLLRFEMSLFHDWLCEKHLELRFDTVAEAGWQNTMQLLVDSALEQPRVFVHRDYHSRNLMVSERDNPGILDFQDAMNGPLTYDLVSLLKDCYFCLPIASRDEFMEYFVAQLDDEVDQQQFLRWFDWMGVQRHLKAAGIFCRLYLRDGKKGYLKDIPRTLAYVLELQPRYEELTWLCGWIAGYVMPALERKT